jgi:hypothetical protein
MRIQDGQPEKHPSVLPLDASATPGVAPPTPAFAQTPGGSSTGAAMDTASMFAGQAAAGTADASAAMSSGMRADADRRGRYARDISPLASSYGDEMSLPPVTSDWSKHTGGSDAMSYDPAG